MRDISLDILRSHNQIILIDYVSNGQKFQIKQKLYSKDDLNIINWNENDNKKSFRFINNDIGYISLKSIKEEDIPLIIKSFKETKGIIIDIRNYPSFWIPYNLGSFFVSSPTSFVKFAKVNYDNPGEFTWRNSTTKIPKPIETYKGKLVILVNELTQSMAEFTSMALQAGNNSYTVGSTTSGTDGNVSGVVLPGRLLTRITGNLLKNALEASELNHKSILCGF